MIRSVILLLFGAICGGVATGLLAPRFIRWWIQPAAGSSMLSCVHEVEFAMSRLLTTQAVGASVVGVAFAIVGWLTARARTARKVAAVPPGPKPATGTES